MTDEDREMDLALAECEQENRLLRARNQRLDIEVQLLTEAVRQLTEVKMAELKPKREWVPVSDEVKRAMQDWQSKYNIIDYVEAWLKEKNYEG